MDSQKETPLPPIIFADDFDEHHRIAWRVEEAKSDPANPLLEGEYPWDDSAPAVGHGTILKDPIDGKFKGWTPVMSSDSPEKLGECEFRLAYIESDDGVDWRRPMFDFCPWDGYEKTNLLFDNNSGGRTTYSSVFVNPQEEEPYEMFCFREPHWRCPARCVAGFGQAPAANDEEVWKYYGLYRYRSRDGIRWRGVEGPLNLKSGDSCYIYRDPKLGYVAHHKVATPAGPGNVIPRYECAPDVCRVTQRRTSPDGTNWSEPTPLISPDRHDNSGDQIMEVGRYPYGDGFLGLVVLYHSLTQRMDLQFAVSTEGEKFWRPIPRSACLPNAPLGDYGGGMIWPYRLPIAHDGRLHVYYGALAGLHGDVYSAKPDMRLFRSGALCRASWEMGRFFAAVNADGGGMPPAHLTTKPVAISGKTLYVNAVTLRGGELHVELLDAAFKPIPGFSKEDCNPFRGDQKWAPVLWKRGPAPPRDSVRTRFYMTTGMLYGYVWM